MPKRANELWEEELASADDVPLRTWWQTYRENGGEELRLLSQRVLERLYELRPAQAGVEELNSCCKFIQAGRQSLLTANARYLTYLYVNRRLLVEYHGAVKPAAGTFRLGCHWPPTSFSAEPALDDALAEAALEKEVITLDASIAALDAADEEALRAEKAADEAVAAAKPRESPRLANKRSAERRAAGRKRARAAQQSRKAGRAGLAMAKEERKRAKKAKKVMFVSSESESDSGASDDDDSGAIELDDDSDDDSAGARSGEDEEE